MTEMVSPLEPLGFPPALGGSDDDDACVLESAVDLRDALRGEKIRKVSAAVSAYPPTDAHARRDKATSVWHRSLTN